jgi:hypothetical protein
MKYYFFWGLFLGCAGLTFHSECISAQQGGNTPVEAALHYAISTEISFASCMFITIKYPQMSLKNKYLISAGVGTLAGVGKELLDLATNGDFDMADIGIDLLGIGTGLVLHYFVFDKKMLSRSVSFQISDHQYLASVHLFFK